MTRAGVVFGGCRKDRADGNIIRTLCKSRSCLLNRSHRYPDNEVVGGKLPGGIDPEIPLAEMDTIGSTGKGNIKPVIDHKQRPGCFCQCRDASAGCQELTAAHPFIAKLDGISSAGESHPGNLLVRPSPGYRFIRYYVKIEIHEARIIS